MYVVLIADAKIDAHGSVQPEIHGPFRTKDEAIDHAFTVERYLVEVLPIASSVRSNA